MLAKKRKRPSAAASPRRSSRVLEDVSASCSAERGGGGDVVVVGDDDDPVTPPLNEKKTPSSMVKAGSRVKGKGKAKGKGKGKGKANPNPNPNPKLNPNPEPKQKRKRSPAPTRPAEALRRWRMGEGAAREGAAAPYKCLKCGQPFKSLLGLQYHTKKNVCRDGFAPRSVPKSMADRSLGGKDAASGGGRHGPAADRTCPRCGRVFSIMSGLAYHLEHRVCERKGSGGGRKKSQGGNRVSAQVRRLAGTAPFPPLPAGAKFVTPYGVVRVLADDRLPADCGATRIGGSEDVNDKALKEVDRQLARYKNRKLREEAREREQWGRLARNSIRRRRKMGRAHEEAKGEEAPKETEQMAIWRLAVKDKGLTPRSILNGGSRATSKASDLSRTAGDASGQPQGAPVKEDPDTSDPLVPRDCYPDRIVTCGLIADKRELIYDWQKSESTKTSNVDYAYEIVRKARKEMDMPEGEQEQGEEGDGDIAHPVISKLYLQRRLLTVPYIASLPIFRCKDCGKIMESRESLKYHVTERVCHPEVVSDQLSSDEDEQEDGPRVHVEGHGLDVRVRRSGKRTKYVEVDSGDDAVDDDDSFVPEDDAESNQEGAITHDGVLKMTPPRPRRPKRKRSSQASIASARSRGSTAKTHRSAAIDNFDPDSDSSVEEISSFRTPQSTSGRPSTSMTPGRERIGAKLNEVLSRKEWKHRKRPSWMEFKADVSCWYPVIMKTLGIRRGSNNRNWKRRKTEKVRFTAPKNVRAERKAKLRLNNGPIYPGAMDVLGFHTGIARKGAYANVYENLGFQKGRLNRNFRMKRRRLPGTGLDSPDICGDEDHNYERHDQLLQRSFNPRKSVCGEGGVSKKANQKSKKRCPKAQPSLHGKKKRRKLRHTSNVVEDDDDGVLGTFHDDDYDDEDESETSEPQNHPAPPNVDGLLIDVSVIAEEIDSGRYPSMKRYDSDHLDVCEVCFMDNQDDIEPLYYCAFCSNSEHLSCLKTKFNILDWTENEDFVCHACILRVTQRRSRAEKRRLKKAGNELAKNGHIRDAVMNMPPLQAPALSPTSTMPAAVPGCGELNDVAIHGFARATISQEAQSIGGADLVSANSGGIGAASVTTGSGRAPCPSGGPGGLICCQLCSAEYSRLLSRTSREIDVQVVAQAGREVGELMELLRDAQLRLRLATDISKEGDERRKTVE